MTKSAQAPFCSLPPEELAARKLVVRREIVPLVRHHEDIADGIACEFDDDPGTRVKLDEFVTFERGCCGGIDFQLIDRPETNRIRLEIHGVDPDATAFASLRAGGRASPGNSASR